MADVNIATGPMVDDLGLIVNVQSARPPFNLPVGIHAKSYKVGVDFESGDKVIFNIKNIPLSTGIKYASVNNVNGAVISILIEDDEPNDGKKITFTAPNADIMVLIIFDI